MTKDKTSESLVNMKSQRNPLEMIQFPRKAKKHEMDLV